MEVLLSWLMRLRVTPLWLIMRINTYYYKRVSKGLTYRSDRETGKRWKKISPIPPRTNQRKGNKMQTKLRVIKGMMLLPPEADKCQKCAVKHKPEEPHDQTSLYYQCQFFQRHGRYPTWEDAIRHCAKPLRDAWEKELKERGVWDPEGNK